MRSITLKRWRFSLQHMDKQERAGGREKHWDYYYHSMVCHGEKNQSVCPSRMWKLNDPSILCSSLLWNLQICDLFQTSSLSSTILTFSRLSLAVPHENCLTGDWDFYCYFIKCLINLWATVMLVVPILMMFEFLETSFLPSYTFSVNTSLGIREIEVGVCFIKKITSLSNKSVLN